MATAVAAAVAAAVPRCFINFPDEDPEGLSGPGLGGGVTEASPGAAVNQGTLEPEREWLEKISEPHLLQNPNAHFCLQRRMKQKNMFDGSDS